MTQKKSVQAISRRDFLTGAAAAAAFTFIPKHVIGQPGVTPPSGKLNLAFCGCGARGRANLNNFKNQNYIALCDPDDGRAREAYASFPEPPKYRDFRKMLDKHKEIDGVVISTPDHNHAYIAMTALKMGKHVYCEKPLTRTVSESRALMLAARQAKVATQMGNQGHSGEGLETICEWIWDGAIGPVREVHAWTDRPYGWAQRGINAPTEKREVPASLDWEMWSMPVLERPYNSAYLNFRAWWPYGTGALGDMGCHIIDPIYSALKLGHTESIYASSTKNTRDCGPSAALIHWQFPARGEMPPVKVHWYDGGILPARPEILEEGRNMGNNDGGCLFVGDKGTIMCTAYAGSPRLIPETAMQEYQADIQKRFGSAGLPKKFPKSPGHWNEWVEACKGGPKASSNFDESAPLSEMMLLGNVAVMIGNNQKLLWDGPNMKVTNIAAANEFVNHQYRDGFSL